MTQPRKRPVLLPTPAALPLQVKVPVHPALAARRLRTPIAGPTMMLCTHPTISVTDVGRSFLMALVFQLILKKGQSIAPLVLAIPPCRK